jgi:hypothetical protein
VDDGQVIRVRVGARAISDSGVSGV